MDVHVGWGGRPGSGERGRSEAAENGGDDAGPHFSCAGLEGTSDGGGKASGAQKGSEDDRALAGPGSGSFGVSERLGSSKGAAGQTELSETEEEEEEDLEEIQGQGPGETVQKAPDGISSPSGRSKAAAIQEAPSRLGGGS